ncbi:GtrA family protein [Glaciihabitans arcticus]|uniref:GtrA family protein n=1 Tax=Glaciihabitans arcticus TaxID=2668039 RepID=A0A4Q9GTQ4_9MICO|nr:GtrA family protein [Glaciihabitans arcticus]TBN55933.1 GtrA family protein [Glaciihabitans arcticus]
MRALLAQLTRFGLVGLVGLVIDVSVFNALVLTVLSADTLHEGPLVAKIISTSLAIVANWLGNRHWTFASVGRRHWLREGIEFAVVSVGGMLISLGCLWVSHYALGFTSVLADNIATNVIGLGLGTAFRFTLYRLWVFSALRGSERVSVRPIGWSRPAGSTAPAADVQQQG